MAAVNYAYPAVRTTATPISVQLVNEMRKPEDKKMSTDFPMQMNPSVPAFVTPVLTSFGPLGIVSGFPDDPTTL